MNTRESNQDKEGEVGGASSEEKCPVETCFICCSNIFHQLKNDKNHSQLSQSLRVVFLLRNLLQVPEDQMEGNLRECGNPENWIRLCEQCSELTRQGEELYFKIVKIDKELRSIRSQIVNKIRSESQSSEEIEVSDDNVKMSRSRRDIWRKTRDFVINYNYKSSIDIDNPFDEGDKRAETLINHIRSPISPLHPGYHGDSDDGAVYIKQERDRDEETSDSDYDKEDEQDYDDKEWCDDDDDWEPEESKKKVPSSSARSRRSNSTKRTRRPPIIIDGKYKCHNCDKLFNSPQMCHRHEQKLHFSKTPGQFPCDLCGKLNDTLGFLTDHKRTAHRLKADGTPAPDKRHRKTNRKHRPPIIIDGKYKCHHCEKLFHNSSSCSKHEQQMHPQTPGQFPCDLCGKLNNSLGLLTEHKRSVHRIKGDGTPVTYVRKSLSNRKNRPAILIDGKYKCHYCDVLLHSRQMCHTHEKRWHTVTADGTVLTRAGIQSISHHHRKNQKAVVINGKYQCRQCDKMFNKRQTCYKHEQNHKRTMTKLAKKRDDGAAGDTLKEGPWKKMILKDKKWACLYCDKRYIAKLSCYIHLVEKHERTPGPFVCDICGISWNKEGYLNIHKRKVHHVTANGTPVVKSVKKVKKVGKEPQTCDLCGKTYATKVCLQNHVRFVHEKRFTNYCHLCGMGFYSSPALQRHLLSMHEDNKEVKRMIEEGAKIWRCEVVGCPTKFVKETGFVEHMKKVHGGDKESDVNEMKKFPCSFCGKGFWQQSQLRQHELIHKNAEEMPFSCEICGVRMATPNYLRNHRRRVHKIYKSKLMDEIV